MSKSYGMTGWRVGFVVGDAEIAERINLLTIKRHKYPRLPGSHITGS